ncbi:hypothetical protein [Burkholderia ubonensis]|uniref:hypothetical protein n=1 Tax=Burkholderia ubonensis TaxID=101571 RepID=UPI003F74DC8D
MTTYLDLKAKIRALQVQAELARKNEVQRVIEEIQKVIAEFDLKPGTCLTTSDVRLVGLDVARRR